MKPVISVQRRENVYYNAFQNEILKSFTYCLNFNNTEINRCLQTIDDLDLDDLKEFHQLIGEIINGEGGES